MENQKEIGIPFKDFLDKSNNLISIFGVFNALSIYSSTIDFEDAKQFLLPTFLLLSLLVWLELISFAIKSADESYKYQLFILASGSIQLGLIYYFTVKFKGLLFVLAIFGIFFLYIFLVTSLLIRIFKSKLSKSNENKKRRFNFIFLIIALITSFFLFKLTTPVIKPISKKVFTEDSTSNKASSFK